tara:strand:- start:34 stop:336 length:303 start_codon:yes stop_codon:yes gene_type:complete
MKSYSQFLIEAGKAKGLDGKACWKGYSLKGTKKKGGKTVDNCVKNEEMMAGNAVGQSGGFGSKSPAKGPNAGYDKGLGKKKKKPQKRYAHGGAGSRKRWM